MKIRFKSVLLLSLLILPFFAISSSAGINNVFSPGAIVKKAQALIKNGKVFFMDRALAPGHASIDSCLWANGDLFILDTYCSANEQKAAAVEFFSAEKGVFTIYTENEVLPSVAKRNQYNEYFWKLSWRPSISANCLRYDESGTISIDDYTASKESCAPTGSGACITVSKEHFCSRREENLSRYPECSKNAPRIVVKCWGEAKKFKRQWERLSKPFWSNPPTEWYGLLKELKELRKYVID